MRSIVLLLAVACVLLLALGCGVFAVTSEGVVGAIQLTKSPLEVGDTSVGQSKVGESRAKGILIVAFGDCSIKAACEDGNITRIHHIDSEEINILGIYAEKIVRVYGE